MTDRQSKRQTKREKRQTDRQTGRPIARSKMVKKFTYVITSSELKTHQPK